jgi:hypothetical protein
VFGTLTTYLGKVNVGNEEPQMAVVQPYIPQDDADSASLEDVEAMMVAHGFARVDGALIVNPEIREVTWYRQRDGLLVTDAHARNFRKDLEGIIVPIDLVISVVPPGASTLLPQPDAQWQPAYLKNDG